MGALLLEIKYEFHRCQGGGNSERPVLRPGDQNRISSLLGELGEVQGLNGHLDDDVIMVLVGSRNQVEQRLGCGGCVTVEPERGVLRRASERRLNLRWRSSRCARYVKFEWKAV